MAAERKNTLPQEGTSYSGESLPELNSGCSRRILGGSNVMQPLESEETRRKTEEKRRPNEEENVINEERRPNGEELSNKTPKNIRPTYVQQTFHKSMFLQTRSSIRSESPNRQDNYTEVYLTPEKTLNSENKTPSNRPNWQRIPTARSNKRKKISQTPSPEGVTTKNSFSDLPLDEIEAQNNPQEKRTSKPPPIILYGIDDINCLAQLLESVVSRNSFAFKIVSKNQLRISCKDIEIYKQIISTVRSNGLIGHTFNIKEQRLYRLVIKNLHHTTPHTAIREEIENTGNKVYGEIINAKFGPEKKPTSTFFINIVPGPNNKDVKNIKYIYHQSVTIEDPKKNTTVPQCQRCQQYGHSKNYCMRPYRCVKCAQGHKTSECPKKDRNTPALCALCQGDHPANYKGCEVYREIMARKMTKNRSIQPKRRDHTVSLFCDIQTPTQTKETNETYADKVKDKQNKEDKRNENDGNTILKLEKLILQQTQKFDTILQQMSTLLGLITTLVTKMTK